MLNVIYPFIVFLLLWVPSTAPAAAVSGLYEGEVPVADQAEATRRQAQRDALAQVLVKLSGDSAIVDDSGAMSLLEQPERYLQQYRYRERTEPGVDGETRSYLYLWAEFDARALDAAVRNIGMSTWARERPASLVWLAVKSDRGRQLVGMEQAAEYLAPLERAAHARGLPLLMPLLDLEDTARLRPDALWEGESLVVRQASERYLADAILSAHVDVSAEPPYEVYWTAHLPDGGEEQWSSRGDSLQAAFHSGMQRYGDLLAARFAPAPGSAVAETSLLRLTVTAVNSVDDYARAQAYLDSLSDVGRVKVHTVAPGKVVFEVEARGGEAALNQAISLGRTLRPESGSDGREYRLLP